MSRTVVANKNKSSHESAINDVKMPVFPWIAIIGSFLLAVLDMVLLYKSVGKVFSFLGPEPSLHMIVAFIIATLANTFAFLWGHENGRNLAEKSLNKKSLFNFMLWVLIGVFYVIVKIIGNGGLDEAKIDLMVLAISYISSGTLIASSAAKIFNRDLADARKFEKRFSIIHEDLVAEAAEIRRLTEVLDNYNEVYESLDKQRDIKRKSIRRSEKASMSSVVGKIIENNPGIDAINVYDVARDEFIKKRQEDDEEGF